MSPASDPMTRFDFARMVAKLVGGPGPSEADTTVGNETLDRSPPEGYLAKCRTLATSRSSLHSGGQGAPNSAVELTGRIGKVVAYTTIYHSTTPIRAADSPAPLSLSRC